MIVTKGKVSKMARTKTGIALMWFELLVAAVGVAAGQGPPSVAGGARVRILMVLKQPGARRDSPKVVKEPDVTQIGGRVITKHDNTIEIDLPLAAVKHLVDDENVAYVQRVWMGEPLDT